MLEQEQSRWGATQPGGAKEKPWRDYVQSAEKKLGAFLEFDPARLESQVNGEGPLKGLVCAVKDNIAVEGFKLTCGSKILEHFSSPYNATAVKRLLEAGARIAGKTNLDEFGMGSSTDNSALGSTNNPWNESLVAGGSSGGSAVAVASGMVSFALGSDTGGSVRQPASFCGIYGLKPTYGTVSRYGLVAYASSLEVIGVFSRTVALSRQVYDVIKGQDGMDHSSLTPQPSGNPSIKRIGVLRGNLGLSAAVEETYFKTIDFYRQKGHQIVDVELPSLDYGVPAYYTIATAEASANLARYVGIRYGLRPDWAENPEDLMVKTRSAGFGPEVKLRILLGTYVLRSGFQDQYYLRAQRIRTAIRNDFERAFDAVDVMLMPVYPTQAFGRGSDGLDSHQQKMADKFTTAANLTGLPALAFPAAVVDGLPVGLQFMAPGFEEERLFAAAALHEEAFSCPVPPKYPGNWS